MKTNKYKADLSINEYRLDQEIIEQPQKFYNYAYLCGEAQNERDDAKDEYDIIKVEIESKLRESNEYSTEGAIKTATENHKKVKRARRKWIEARNKYNLLNKAEKAFEQRKSMLQTYVYHKSIGFDSDVKVSNRFHKERNSEFSSDIRSQLRSSKKMKKLKRRKKY